MNNLEKFEKSIKKFFIKGQQNNNLLQLVNKAKFFEISEFEAIGIIKSNWIGEFTNSDQNSFNNAWKKTSVEKTVSDSNENNLEQKIQNIESNSKINEELNNLSKIKKYINEIEFSKNEFVHSINEIKLTKTSKDILKWFNEDDVIWISSSYSDDSDFSFKDVKTFADKENSLSQYSYWCFNTFNYENMIRSDKTIKSFKYFLLESDSLELKEQIRLYFDMIKFGIPIKSLIYSGGKSIHALFYLKNINSKKEYDDYISKIYDMFKNLPKGFFDEACKNPSRLSRSPFGSYDKKGDNFGKEQSVLYLNEDKETEFDVFQKLYDYFEMIGIIKKESKKLEIESKENEFLKFLNNDYIYDIWKTPSSFNIFRRDIINGEGKVLERFSTSTSFYYFCFQNLDFKLKDQLNKKELNALKEIPIKCKVEYFKACLNPNKIEDDKVNLFKNGFLNEIINDDSIDSKLNEPLRIFLNNIFGTNREEMLWTLSWMHDYMHNFKKMITCPVFWGIQGNGKSMIANCFGNAIGSCIEPKQSQMEDSRFNSWLRNAVIILNEVSCGSKRDGKIFGDYLKGLITEEKQTIENKGRDIEADVSLNNAFIVTANVSTYIPPVFLEDGDRRFTIIRNDNAVNLQELWTRNDFDKWDDLSYQKQLIKWIYFTDFNKDGKINVRRGLENKFKKEITNMGRNKYEEITDLIIENFSGKDKISNEEIKRFMQNELNENWNLIISKILKGKGCKKLVFKDKALNKTVNGFDFSMFGCKQEEITEEKNNLMDI